MAILNTFLGKSPFVNVIQSVNIAAQYNEKGNNKLQASFQINTQEILQSF